MFGFLISMLLIFTGQSTYLKNEDSNIKYMDIRTGGAITTNYQYPYIGFGCSLSNGNNTYLVTKTHYLAYWARQQESSRCNKPHKKVEVMKYKDDIYIDSVLTIQTSDYIVSCGIYKNILYYISGNYYNCPSSYNLDSSITRIDLTDFSFIDKTILRNIPGVPTFSPSSYWDYKYIDSPTTSITIDSLWLGFGGHFTGIWRLNVTSTPIKLLDSYQKKWTEVMENEMSGMGDYESEIRFQHIKKSFKLNNTIYFVDDSGYRDVKLLVINTTNKKKMDNNNTNLITLDGINYISDIEIDEFREKIYIVTGLLNSELYQFDYNFNKISLSVNCNIDFLKFPTEWGLITNIILDKKTRYIYALISTKHSTGGIVKINSKDLTIDTYKKFGEWYNYTYIHHQTGETKYNRYYNEYLNMNITSQIIDGKLFILPNENYNRKKMIIMDLYGCSTGFGFNSNICEICKPGKYSDEIGKGCKDCNPGFSSDSHESIVCKKCMAGKFTTGTYNINCLDCDAGKYAEIEGSSNCINCESGKYSIIASSKSKDNCLNCEAGKISDDGVTSCTFCEIGEWAKYMKTCIGCFKGKYSISLGLISSDECLLCPIGKYTDEIGLSTELNCKICENGKIGIVEGAVSNTSCVNCPIGKFKQSLMDCDICPDGWISNILDNKCDICEIGKWALDKKICIDCDLGSYSFSTGLISASQCILCEKGKYQLEKAQITESACLTCGNGKVGVINGAKTIDSCVNCPIGKFKQSLIDCYICPDGWISNILDNKCDICEMGKWALDKKSCISCPKGKYSFNTGLISESECILCEKGKYQPEKEQIRESSCLTCRNGKIGVIDGSKSNNSCVSCDRGKFKKSLTKCQICPDGWISEEESNECIICPIGQIANLHGFECNNCSLGKYNDLPGLSIKINNCKDCDPGKYSNRKGNININYCKKCQSGKYNIEYGLTDESFCISCESGKYRGLQQNSGQPCIICTNGKYSISESSSCKTCVAGKYSTNTFKECLNCPTGRYNILPGQHTKNTCILCASGKWNDGIGSTTPDYCIECEPGLYSNIEGADSILTCKECPEGRYNEIKGADSMNDCKECSTGSYSITGSIDCILCEPGKFNSIMGSPQCDQCEEGKYTEYGGAFICSDCPDNSEQNYLKDGCICSASSYNTKNNETICSLCTNEFICDKGTEIKTLKLKKHYWRQSENIIKTYKCKNIYACKGGLITNSSDNLCNAGHKGPLCDVCEKGWAKDDGVCLKCPDNATRTIGLTIFIPLVCIFLIMFLVKTANPSNNKKEEINGVVKIFMNYAQVFSLASSFQINWPSLIRYLFERAKEFSSPRVSFYSSDCAIGWSYYDKLIVYLALPIFYMVVVTIIISLISLCYCSNNAKKLNKFTKKEDRDKYIARKPTCMKFFTAWEKTAIVVGTFLSWPTIVEKTLEVMNCEKIGDIYYLVKDVSVICYDSKHYQFLMVSYIAIIIYGIGIPLSGFYLLYKYRYRLYDMQNRYDGSTPLSFLFLGYREKRWYYEFIIMGKKAGLILISVFLKNHPRYQIIGASLLVQISFFLHVFLRPYDNITSYGMICNKLESISLLSLVMTLSTGLFFGTIDSGYQLGLFEDILIILLITSNGGIVLYFFIYFLVLGKKTAISHLRDSARSNFDEDNKPWFICCCNEDRQNSFKKWVYLQESDNYGIHLKNDLEKQIFSNYFREKKSKLNILNDKIDKLSKRRVSIQLDKVRSEIQVMEKQRCWQTIQNNRLYGKLKKIAMVNKIGLNETEINELNDVFKLYVKHGVKYNDKMNDLYMGELKDMVPDSPHLDIEMTNKIVFTENQISRMIINGENTIII